ncbi:MAG TPA: hypothetical protein VMV76_07715 [Dehalococcoidia bacterium]|nr:hypothetical protein [Dehalococcoidia bacterium]
MWQPSVIEGRPPTFLGYPIHAQDNMATLAGAEGVIAAVWETDAGLYLCNRFVTQDNAW